MAKCYFTKIDKCAGDEATELVKAGPQGVQTIINCSIKYDDNLYHELEANIENDSEFSFFTHRSCVSTYILTHTSNAKCFRRIILINK